MENLPEKRPESPLAPSPEGKRELVVRGGEIYLPESRRFTPGDEEFAAVVAEVLPDYAPALSEEALRRPRGYSAWAILLILLFLGSLGAIFFFLRPRVRLENTAMRVPPPETLHYLGKFSRQFKQVQEYVKAERYGDARRALEPMVDQLLERKEAGPRNEPLFYTYFALFERLEWDREAAARLKRLIELDDNFRWSLFDIMCRMALLRVDKPEWISPGVSMGSLYDVRRRIDALRRRLHDKPELTRMLDLCRCQCGLKVWRLKNRPEPDDEYGLEDREEVWRIASRYPRDRSFLEIRRYLVMRLLLDDPRGYYVFAGQEYLLNSHLRTILREINAELARLKEKP